MDEGGGGRVICRYFTSGMNNFEASGFIDISQVNFINYTKKHIFLGHPSIIYINWIKKPLHFSREVL